MMAPMRFHPGRLAATCALCALAFGVAGGTALAAPELARPAHRSTPVESVNVGLATIPHVTVSNGAALRRIVTVDFDRDGDLDVLAATDQGVLLWLNDGHGNLVVQHPNPAPVVVTPSEVATWRDHCEDSSESIQNDLPSLRFASSYAHAPPAAARSVLRPSSTGALHDASAGSLIPRAPPVLA